MAENIEDPRRVGPSLTWQRHAFHCLAVVASYGVLYIFFFYPILFSHRLLAPGDAALQSVPAFYASLSLWTDLLFSGFPVAADPQIQSWYPLAWLFSQHSAGWNPYVLCAYVLASGLTYGYVYTLTRSSLAAAASGITFGMSGFMMAHLGHTTIIHTAIWLPFLLWSFESLGQELSRGWILAAALGIALGALAGHPQIFLYTLSLVVLYVAVTGWEASVGRMRYYTVSTAILLLGSGLAAIQLLPSIELAAHSGRAHWNYELFVAHSLSPAQSLGFLFPYLFGGRPESVYGVPYFGAWGPTELTGYIGLLPLMCAVIASLAYRHKRLVWFWIFVALLAYLMALGGHTPLARLVYLLPLYNKFQVPARHLLEVSFAISVLAGLGVAAIRESMADRRAALLGVLTVAGITVIGLAVIFIGSAELQALALDRGIVLQLSPLENPAVAVPLAILLIAAVVLFFWSGNSASRGRQFLLLIVLAIDLASFGWFCEWRFHSPEAAVFRPRASMDVYRDALSTDQQRMVTVNGGKGFGLEVFPNVSMLWNIPNLSGYNPLIPLRIKHLLSMGTNGEMSSNWSVPSNQSLDVMATRYAVVNRRDTLLKRRDGLAWDQENLHFLLGQGCGADRGHTVLSLPIPVRASAVGVVSGLKCAAGIANEQPVLRVSLADNQGRTQTTTIRAGLDTAESLYECSIASAATHHQPAPVFSTFPVQGANPRACSGHSYFAVLPLTDINQIKRVTLRWVGPAGSAVRVYKITFIDRGADISYPLTADLAGLAETARWRLAESIGRTSIFENKNAMSRAWLVPEVVRKEPGEILRAIRTSRMADGRRFQPAQLALVEDPFSLPKTDSDSQASVRVLNLSPNLVEVQTESRTPAFLVMSDLYYPGWRALIDGHEGRIFRTNYVMRGVPVPPGVHLVRFEYVPRSVVYGAAGSLGALIFLTGLIFLVGRSSGP
jgi:hypothetical protein